jgi:hypothetical protein
VAEVQVAGARVEAAVHAQRVPFLPGLDQALAQLLRHGPLEFLIAVFRAAHQVGDLFVDIHECLRNKKRPLREGR